MSLPRILQNPTREAAKISNNTDNLKELKKEIKKTFKNKRLVKDLSSAVDQLIKANKSSDVVNYIGAFFTKANEITEKVLSLNEGASKIIDEIAKFKNDYNGDLKAQALYHYNQYSMLITKIKEMQKSFESLKDTETALLSEFKNINKVQEKLSKLHQELKKVDDKLNSIEEKLGHEAKMQILNFGDRKTPAFVITNKKDKSKAISNGSEIVLNKDKTIKLDESSKGAIYTCTLKSLYTPILGFSAKHSAKGSFNKNAQTQDAENKLVNGNLKACDKLITEYESITQKRDQLISGYQKRYPGAPLSYLFTPQKKQPTNNAPAPRASSKHKA